MIGDDRFPQLELGFYATGKEKAQQEKERTIRQRSSEEGDQETQQQEAQQEEAQPAGKEQQKYGARSN